MYALIIISIVLFVVLIPFAIVRRRDHLSGDYGERKTSELLIDVKQDDEIVINNYIASRNRNNTASIQIDHIFISHKGIFVIETKDYRGRIYGGRYQNSWTQVLAYGEVKNKLYNPIKQNETHCNYIDRLLDRKYLVYNVVVFIKADISRVSDSSSILFEPYSFKRWYRSLPPDSYMTTDEIHKINEKIQYEMCKKPITKEEHVRNVRRRHK